MLPLSLLKCAINHPMLVELKNGETYNGHLASCDAWMNIHLTQVICTSKDGDRFWKMPECFIRGSTIKYLRIPDEVVDNFKEDSSHKTNYKGRGSDASGRGGRGGGNVQRGGRGGGARGGGSNKGGNTGNRMGNNTASTGSANSNINKGKQRR